MQVRKKLLEKEISDGVDSQLQSIEDRIEDRLDKVGKSEKEKN